MLSSFDIIEQARRNVLGRLGFVPTNFLQKGDLIITIFFWRLQQFCRYQPNFRQFRQAWNYLGCKHKISDPNIMFKEGVISLHRSALYTEVRFASFLSGGFITAIVVNPPERKLAKRSSLCGNLCICKQVMTCAVVSVRLQGFYIGGFKVNLLTKITFSFSR